MEHAAEELCALLACGQLLLNTPFCGVSLCRVSVLSPCQVFGVSRTTGSQEQ